MGLRHLAENKTKSRISEHGLKKKLEAIRSRIDIFEVDKPFFFQSEKEFKSFLDKIEIEKAAFLIKNDEENYIISFPVNLTLTSFQRLIIPARTIEKVIDKKDNWNNVKELDFSLFRNFFASQEYISITEIILYSLNNDEFIILIKSLKDTNRKKFNYKNANLQLKHFIPIYQRLKKIFKKAKPIYPFQSGKNTIELKINSALTNYNNANLFKISLKAIFPDATELQTNIESLRLYSSIINIIMQSIGKSNIAILKKDLLVCIFSQSKIPINIYINQMKINLLPIFGERICNNLIFENMGISNNKKEILSFLNIEEHESKL